MEGRYVDAHVSARGQLVPWSGFRCGAAYTAIPKATWRRNAVRVGSGVHQKRQAALPHAFVVALGNYVTEA